LPVVCRVWGADTSGVAGDDATGELWATGASDGGYVTGQLGASQREVQDILAPLYQTEVSVGGIGALEQAVRAALAAPVVEAERYVQRQPGRNADETSWREKTQGSGCGLA